MCSLMADIVVIIQAKVRLFEGVNQLVSSSSHIA